MALATDHGVFVREAEFERLKELVTRRGPGLALLVGPPGSGKSTLLSRLEAFAREHGWWVPKLYGRDFTVGLGTNSDEFCAEVRGMLGSAPSSSAYSTPTSLIQQLGALGPTLLTVDDYRPSAEFADWFETSFMGEARAAGTPLVVVLAARPGFESDGEDMADALVRLGRLGEEPVRIALQEAAVGLDPPLAPAELNAYVEAGCDDPEVLDGLLVLLRLASESIQRQEAAEHGRQ